MNCSLCNKLITGSGKKFCSLSCSSTFNAKRGPKTNKIKKCLECNNDFYAKENRIKFCSRTCSATFNNIKKSPKNNCIYCGLKILSNKRYCSRKCLTDMKIDSWINNKTSACNKYSIASWARKYILEQAEFRCEAIDIRTGFRCNEDRIHSKTGNSILQIDHIDGNWMNCDRNNLRAICPTCHVLTDTWGSLNAGFGRSWKNNYSQFNRKNQND